MCFSRRLHALREALVFIRAAQDAEFAAITTVLCARVALLRDLDVKARCGDKKIRRVGAIATGSCVTAPSKHGESSADTMCFRFGVRVPRWRGNERQWNPQMAMLDGVFDGKRGVQSVDRWRLRREGWRSLPRWMLRTTPREGRPRGCGCLAEGLRCVPGVEGGGRR